MSNYVNRNEFRSATRNESNDSKFVQTKISETYHWNSLKFVNLHNLRMIRIIVTILSSTFKSSSN